MVRVSIIKKRSPYKSLKYAQDPSEHSNRLFAGVEHVSSPITNVSNALRGSPTKKSM